MHFKGFFSSSVKLYDFKSKIFSIWSPVALNLSKRYRITTAAKATLQLANKDMSGKILLTLLEERFLGASVYIKEKIDKL